MFSRNTLQSLGFLLVLSLALGQGLLALVCALLLLTAGLARLWDRWSLVRLAYERELSHPRAFPDDEIELAIRIANRKPLPLRAWMCATTSRLVWIWSGTTCSSTTTVRRLLHRSTSMRWYEALTWRYRVRCLARHLPLRPAQLESGDPFGFYRSSRDVVQRAAWWSTRACCRSMRWACRRATRSATCARASSSTTRCARSACATTIPTTRSNMSTGPRPPAAGSAPDAHLRAYHRPRGGDLP